ncbi:hypothetical protein EVG20_g9078 [Dentipellis fragilis]|uniref:HNH nuclease domain-containing protein n=1 Tax=Dentipellis fragilis TaxID=205917 RepID=A0A4Y9Y2A7_9AGAM|nr:hypothetical protein EVG20_g9078 [Dentipellis fragilis]
MASHSQKSSLSSHVSSDPGLVSDKDSIASFGLTSAASPKFNKLVSDFIDTRDLSDEDLRERANKHLRVLTLDSFEKYNMPKWITRVPLPTGTDRHRFNMKRLFDAMYQTASELSLISGARYVSAAICACAALAASMPQEKQLEQLAAELCKLGGTWVAYMLWPFLGNSKPQTNLEEPSAAATPTIKETSDSMSDGNPVRREEKFRDEVLLRDNYTCCITGAVQTDAPAHLNLQGTWIVKALEAAHIFRRSVSVFQPGNADKGKRASLAATYDILRHYCQLDANIAETMSQMDGAHNGIVLEHNAHQAFDDFGFCLQAEEEANTYRLKIYTALPSPELLRLHAALTGVFNLSAAAGFLELFKNPSDSEGPAVGSDYGEDFEYEVIEYDGDKISRMRDLTAAVRGLIH